MRRSRLDVKRAELCNWLPAGQLRHPEVQGIGDGCFGDVPAQDGFDEVDDGFVHGAFSQEMKKPTLMASEKWTYLGRLCGETMGIGEGAARGSAGRQLAS